MQSGPWPCRYHGHTCGADGHQREAKLRNRGEHRNSAGSPVDAARVRWIRGRVRACGHTIPVPSDHERPTDHLWNAPDFGDDRISVHLHASRQRRERREVDLFHSKPTRVGAVQYHDRLTQRYADHD